MTARARMPDASDLRRGFDRTSEIVQPSRTRSAGACGAVRNEDRRRPAARQEKPAALGAAGSSRSTQRRVLIAPISPALASSAWHQHAVDHVNNAVRLEHVLNRDPGGVALGVADGQRLALEFDRELSPSTVLNLALPPPLLEASHKSLTERRPGTTW